VNAPWGLATDYDDDWVGRYHARRSELRTFNFNPAVAYRVNDWLALGAGVQAQYIDVELTNAIDFGTIGFVQTGGALGTPARNDGAVKMEGDDWGFGFNLGVLIEPWRGTRFGAAYRSSISHDIEGSADFTLDSAGVAATLQGISAGMGQAVPFVDTGARAETEVPETVSFGVYHEFDDRWAIMGEAAWTRWSRFDELRVQFDNPGQADSVTDESWQDSWFLAGGVSYRPDEDWTLRAGVAYDQTPIPDSNRTPRLPSNDRLWLAVGASYQAMENLKVEFAFTHIFVDDATIDLTTDGVGNTFRGNLSGDIQGGAIDIVGVQVSYKF
jgi:long-chain fatty acid transport protein